MIEKIVENVEREYKKYDELVCSKLRITSEECFWVAKHKDPCPDCENTYCHSAGQEFDSQLRLIILKEVG